MQTQTPQLNFSGTAGQKTSQIVRLSRTGEGPAIGNLIFEATPLAPAERDDQAVTAPKVEVEPFVLVSGDPPTDILVTLDLRSAEHGQYHAIKHGQYHGYLRILQAPTPGNDSAGSAPLVIGEIPITLKVRHDWHLPVFILSLGVLLGIFTSYYRSRGRARDVIITGRDRLAIYASDSSWPEPFRARLTSLLIDLDDQIKKSDLIEGRKSLDVGDQIALRFRRRMGEWVELCSYIDNFERELNALPQSAETVQKTRDEIRNLKSGLPDELSTDPVRQRLTLWRGRVEQFQKGLEGLGELSKQRSHLSTDSGGTWSEKESAFKERLDQLAPDDVAGFAAFHADLVTAHKQLAELLDKEAKSTRGLIAPEMPPWSGYSAQPLTNVPVAQPPRRVSFPSYQDWMGAIRRSRIHLFDWFSYGFPVAVFVYAGLNEGYFSNPIFGTLANYVALFLWGFGADASSTRVQALIRETGSKMPFPEELTAHSADSTRTNPKADGGKPQGT